MSDTTPDPVRTLCMNAYEVYKRSLSPSSRANKLLFDVLSNPREGDLVLETSTLQMGKVEPWQSIGRLKMRISDSEAVFELIFHEGEEFHWGNASFIRVLEEPFPFRVLYDGEWTNIERVPSRLLPDLVK